MSRLYILAAVIGLCSAAAQELRSLIDWEKLLPKAVESVNVTLDGTMLGFASKALSPDKPGEAGVKKMLGGLKGIYVKSLKFEKEGEYSQADVDKIRSVLRAPEWTPIVDVQSRRGGDNAGVYIKSDGKQILGMVVIAAEPKELTLVEINGSLDPEQLKNLGGNFGIPQLDLEKKQQRKKDE